jgi:hypothetical protein
MAVPSSTSSSEALPGLPDAVALRDTAAGTHDRYARQTAADRPGVAQPVPLRPVPQQPWGRILLGAVALLALMVGGWEGYWHALGAIPSISNSFGLWAIQRRRIDAGEGDATVLIGDSRMYFDVQLAVWERLDGRRPIQLSFEGTSALPVLEDLAADRKFTGRVVIGIAPDTFFPDHRFRAEAVRYAHKESPSQRIGQWLSMHFIEPYFAFDDPDYALQTVLARQPWPVRFEQRWPVRKIAVTEADRNTHLWSKVETDPQYQLIARNTWLNHMQHWDDDPPPAKEIEIEKKQIEAAARAVATLRARGVKVLFVRMPSDGPYLEFEARMYPRARTWDALLAASGAPGIHFEDYPQLQGYDLPEWSHISVADTGPFTAALYRVIQQDFWGPNAPLSVAGGGESHDRPARESCLLEPVPLCASVQSRCW